jgi:hypothetical protein
MALIWLHLSFMMASLDARKTIGRERAPNDERRAKLLPNAAFPKNLA